MVYTAVYTTCSNQRKTAIKSPNKKELKDAIRTKNPIKILSEGLKSVKILKLKSSKMIDAIKNIDSGIVISTRIEHNKLLSKYGNKNLITIAQEHTYHKIQQVGS